MGYRLSKIYTKTGDNGYTQLGNEELSKDDLAIDALGHLDELNASLGLIITSGIKTNSLIESFIAIQHDLFNLGGEIHAPQYPKITLDKINSLEKNIDTWNEKLSPLKEFILPGGNLSAAHCHLARTICRRTERAFVRLHRCVPLANNEILPYLNRLSDWLFVASRILNLETQTPEMLWNHERHK